MPALRSRGRNSSVQAPTLRCRPRLFGAGPRLFGARASLFGARASLFGATALQPRHTSVQPPHSSVRWQPIDRTAQRRHLGAGRRLQIATTVMPLILPSRWPRGSLEFVAEQAARAAALNSFVFAPMGSPSWWQPESMAEGGGGKRRKTSDNGLSGCNQHCAPSARKQSLEAII